MNKQYFYLYKTTNLINNKIYIGVHASEDINDEYLGSGKLLRKSIKKYGIENFKREILEFFETPEEMYKKEYAVVDEEFIKRKDTYNIQRGGEGGWLHSDKNGNIINIGHEGIIKKYGENWSKILSEKAKEKFKEKYNTEEKVKEYYNNLNKLSRTDKSRTKRQETLKRNKHQQGSKNSQFGTIWVFNEQLNKNLKIKKELLNEYLTCGWIKGRKLNLR
jgi:hypothetical protein